MNVAYLHHCWKYHGPLLQQINKVCTKHYSLMNRHSHRTCLVLCALMVVFFAGVIWVIVQIASPWLILAVETQTTFLSFWLHQLIQLRFAEKLLDRFNNSWIFSLKLCLPPISNSLLHNRLNQNYSERFARDFRQSYMSYLIWKMFTRGKIEHAICEYLFHCTNSCNISNYIYAWYRDANLWRFEIGRFVLKRNERRRRKLWGGSEACPSIYIFILSSKIAISCISKTRKAFAKSRI